MMVLVTGGASSGKSAYAEDVACSLPGPHYYLAAMKPYGEEGARRIARHRALRAGKGFVTIECYEDLRTVPASMAQLAPGTALLESLGNVVANALFDDEWVPATYEQALEATLEGIEVVERHFDNVVIVGDEVGGDGLSYEGSTETYVRVIGAASCAIAQRCDTVVECVAGQPFMVKGGRA